MHSSKANSTIKPFTTLYLPLQNNFHHHHHPNTMNLLPIFASPLILIPLSAAAAAAAPAFTLQLISLLSIKSSLRDPTNSFHDWEYLPAAASSRRPSWCSWSGVICNRRTHHVTALDLSGRNLSGDIHSNIKYLIHLQTLNLSCNSFNGPLPTTIFDLPNLRELDINHNFFNSSFSPGISKLRSLTYLNAYSNSFTGPLPEELVRLRNLEHLNLGGSYFEGRIPSAYGTFSKLKTLYLHGNSLTGPIPSELGFLNQLHHLELGYNAYTGGVPPQFSRLSNLVYLDISSANLSGNLPSEFGTLLKMETLLLFKNSFSGHIPTSWAQMRSLQVLDLSDNNLSGEIPAGFPALKALTRLSLMDNKLTGEIPQGFGELPNLEILLLWNNSLTGILPQRLGSNSRLQWLDVSSNSLTGPIPPNLCLGRNLSKLILFSNQFVGEIPSSLANCNTLYRVRIGKNFLNGSIPSGFGSFPNLTFFEVSYNRLCGPIPADLGNAVSLQLLDVSGNLFDSELPGNIWNAPSLQILKASSCSLNGEIPSFIGCRSVYLIEMDGNNLSGMIPSDIGRCNKLIRLDLSRNFLTGIIPSEISTLPSITDVDLSFNFLTGTIPVSLNKCGNLENLNVSYNQLTGPVPSAGFVFSSLHPSSFVGNEGLCGGVVKKPCRTEAEAATAMEVHHQPKKKGGVIVWITAAAFGVGLLALLAGARCVRSRKLSSDADGPWKLTAFQRLNFTAGDVLDCLNTSNEIIGMGATGTVYKAEMPGGETIAVKKLWGKNKDTLIRERKGVLAEVEVLGNVRHRNIVRLLGCCSNSACTMLLYEYMPNGSLDELLHGKAAAGEVAADWVTRYKIAVGVAQGMCYLHHDCSPVIVHRDLKPSNILLDAQMEARVADFGVAKLLIQSDDGDSNAMSMSMSVVAGSYGYIAPEYAYTLQVDEKSDIYSFGVVLLEILTGRRAVDTEFGDGNSIVDWVRSKMKTKNDDDLFEVLDKNGGVREEMMLLLRVALLCTTQNPADRPSMRDVVSMLVEAQPKRKFLHPKIPAMEC